MSGDVERDPEPSPRRAATQRKLLRAAREVITERGLEAASVEDICARAGFTRGAFYSNYSTKEDLALALLKTYADARVETAKGTMARIAANPPASVGAAIDAGVEEFVRLQPMTLEEVVVAEELELYMLRHPSFGPSYHGMSWQAMDTIYEALVAVIRPFGARLRLGRVESMLMIRGVFEHGAIRLLDGDHKPDSDLIRRTVSALLHYLVIPEENE